MKRWTNKAKLAYNRRLVNRFFNNLQTRGGIVGDQAILFVYNDECPELSYIITEQI